MNWTLVLNALLFQLTWLGCVIGGARGEWFWGAIGVFALLAFSYKQAALKRDLPFVLVLVVVGFCFDSLWATTGIIDFGEQAQPFAEVTLAPGWITLLWAGVALTVTHSLGFFVARPRLGALMAGCAAFTAYLGGERLGAVVIPEVLALGWVSCLWGITFFLTFSWAGRVLAIAERAKA